MFFGLLFMWCVGHGACNASGPDVGVPTIAQQDKYCAEHPNNEPLTHEELAGEETWPLCRVPPIYPEACMDTAKAKEHVLMEYDITPAGRVVNPRVIESTNPCLNQAAVNTVKVWRYASSDNGRKGGFTSIVFNLADDTETLNFSTGKWYRKDD